MIRIKAIDAQNILDVCKLTTDQGSIGTTMDGHFCCNAISIAEAKYNPELHPNAIYNNNVLIGFFMYQQTALQADTVTICRFRVDYKFQNQGLGKKAFGCILNVLKSQGVRKVVLMIDETNQIAKNLYVSFGFTFTGKMDKDEYYYELTM